MIERTYTFGKRLTLGLWGFAGGFLLTAFIVPDGLFEEFWIVPSIVLMTLLISIFAPIRFHGDFLKGRQKALEMVLRDGDTNLDATFTSPVRTSNFRSLADRELKFFNAISGDGWQYADHSFAIYEKTKNSEYKAATVYYSILEIDLPRRLPNILFDSAKSHNKQFHRMFDRSERHSLEGDFDQYFTTYFPKHYKIDSLAIISPEVMQAMIAANQYDIEIVGDKLYLYGPLIPASMLPEMIKRGLAVRDALMNNIVTYRDERIAGNEGRERVTSHGAALRENPYRGWTVMLLGLVFVVSGGFTILDSGSEEKGDAFELLIYGVVMVGFTVFDVWRKVQHNKSLDRKYASLIVGNKSRSLKTAQKTP